MRIMLMGLPGADTKALAELYRSIYALPVFYLEHICRTEDGQPRDLAVARQVLAAELRNPDWILVGNYPALDLERRLKAADSVVLYAPHDLNLSPRERFRLRQDTGRMKRLFDALIARQDAHIHLLTDLSQDPFAGAFVSRASEHH